MRETSVVVRLFCEEAPKEPRAKVVAALELFDEPLLTFAFESGIRIRPLRADERYSNASEALHGLGVDVDAWPVPPAGLFVVAERTVYLRSHQPMTVVHEFGHALDCALGGGKYLSGSHPAIRAAFSSAQSFVTPYAACGLDEYFAECVRAYLGANDSDSPWPPATRERLAEVDPAMLAIISGIFERGGRP